MSAYWDYIISDENYNSGPVIYRYMSDASHKWTIWKLIVLMKDGKPQVDWTEVDMNNKQQRDEFLQWAIVCGNGCKWTDPRD